MMRLLEHRANGDFVITEHSGDEIPAYAILSHTWLEDNSQEVSFQDLESGEGKSKAGYKKIRFCADKAAADGLKWFWIDTCCIDKKNAVELAAAINSMFRWYRNATRCYVYLSDVSIHDRQAQPVEPGLGWETAFRRSRWFQRGWTLQELIAPPLLTFFSSEGEQLGNKLLLEALIHDITSIPKEALRGAVLSDFSIEERKSWAKHRNTKLEEDEIYSLLGIFDVSMPLIYGEGREKASRRLEEEIHKSYKGADFEPFTVGFDRLAMPEPAEFVAREEELIEMHKLLFGHTTQSTVILSGLGGIGKTQLAIEYARKHKEKYTAIFWMNANDEDSLRLSIRDVAQQILGDHPSASVFANVDLDGELDLVVSAVKAWLSLRNNRHWLAIYDNYDNPRIPGNLDPLAVNIRQYLPRSDHGSIIITTRSAQVTCGHNLPIQKLRNIQEGLEILSNTSGRQGIKTNHAAIELTEKLDGLPLALSTAGIYLRHMTTSFSQYLRLHQESWLKLQQTSPQLASYQDRSLYTTWQITFDQIKQQNQVSATLLKFWAYFDRQDMWFELLRHASSAKDKWIRKLTEDELIFNEAVRLLCDYGLVETGLAHRESSRSGRYTVHSCVHMWTANVLNQEWDKDLAQLALTCVALEVPSTEEREWWLLQQRLLPHATVYLQLIGDRKLEVEGLERELDRLGTLYRDQGKLVEAEQMYTRALQGFEETFGPQHPSTLIEVNNLGLLYKGQGKLREAEQMYTRALQGKEKALGPQHPSTLDTVHNLGDLYRDQGKLREAEQMYTRALQGREDALGPQHILTLDTINDLGSLYKDKGNLSKAKQMYTWTLQRYEQALGPQHPSTLCTANNLGNLYCEQGKLGEAEQMYTRVLQGYEETLGQRHISTLSAVNNLGNLYSRQGKLGEAEQMYTRALQGYEEALGRHVSSYPPALNTTFNLGSLYAGTRRQDMAKAMYTRALFGFATVKGPSSDTCQDIIRLLEKLDVGPRARNNLRS